MAQEDPMQPWWNARAKRMARARPSGLTLAMTLVASLVLALGLALVLTLTAGCNGGGGPAGVDAALDGATQDASLDAIADAAVDAAVDPRFTPLLQSLEAERVALGAPGVAVAVIEGDEVTFAAGLGTRHPDGGDPVRATTLFRIGSVTKMLTAVGLLQQVHAGQTTLDASVTTPLPDFDLAGDPAWAPSIRVRDLLTHRSGLVDHIEINATAAYAGPDGLHDYLTGPFGTVAYLMAPAGRFWNYTNPGFMLAGLLVEELSGTYYRDYLATEVLAPLGMHRTWFAADEVLADGDYAFGDTVHWETGVPVVVGPDSYDNPWAGPAGYAWSSVLDLAAFVRFLRNGAPAVLPDALRQDMAAPQVDMETLLDRQHYGFGLFVYQGLWAGNDFYEITIISHGGAINGYSADLYWLPDQDVGIVILANTDGAYFNQSVLTALLTLADLPAPTAGPDLTVDPADFDRYVGDYDDPHNVGPMAVTLDGSDLRITIPLLDAMAIPYEPLLGPVLPGNFELTVQGYPLALTFILDGQGDSEYLRTRIFVGTRVAPPAPPPPAPARRRPTAATRERLLRLLQQARHAPSPWRLLPR
jgi:CubicO group peptidase (beta-lactamase class C family)